jgi:ABC-type polysaccharide/polyol phosphate export permease
MPLTHAVKISRAVFSGAYDSGLIFSFLIIFGLEVIAFYIGLKSMKRRLIK